MLGPRLRQRGVRLGERLTAEAERGLRLTRFSMPPPRNVPSWKVSDSGEIGPWSRVRVRGRGRGWG